MPSYDDVLYPLAMSYGSSGGPTFKTSVLAGDSGFEVRKSHWSQALLKLDLAHTVGSQQDLFWLLSFFRARYGRARAFKVRDWSDFSTAVDGFSAASPIDQPTFQLTPTTFQLQKTYSAPGEIFPVNRKICIPDPDTLQVAVGGQIASGWTLNPLGVISFTSPPNGQVTAGFEFLVPMRFDADDLAISLDAYLSGSAHVPVMEVRLS